MTTPDLSRMLGSSPDAPLHPQAAPVPFETVPVPVVVAWSGGAAPYRFVRLRLDDTPQEHEYVPAQPTATPPAVQAQDAKDAARYRWLCEKLGETQLPTLIERITNGYVADYKPSIDATIDAAMAAGAAAQGGTPPAVQAQREMVNALRSLLRHAERVNEVLAQECGVRFVDDGPLGMARDALRAHGIGAAAQGGEHV